MRRFSGNFFVSETAQIGENVRIGNNSIIYDSVEIGENSIICENCIIGEPNVESYYKEDYINPRTVIGANSLVRSGSILYSGSFFGEYFITGNMVSVRENTVMGKNCVVGTQSDIQGNTVFGDYCRLNSHVQISSQCKFGSFVFVYPFVVFTNDPHPPSEVLLGSWVGNFSQIGAGAVILPGVKIGKHSLIGANSLVNKDVGDFQLHAGNPAIKICTLNFIMSKEKKGSHYPWQYNYDKGLPWQKNSFDEWADSEEGRMYV